LYQSFHPWTYACTAGLTGQHFEIILQTIAPHLTSNNVSGKEQIPPEKTIVIVYMVHFKPGVHARSRQFIWHFDLDCSWDSIGGLPFIQPDI
jgi:hypothetical protein